MVQYNYYAGKEWKMLKIVKNVIKGIIATVLILVIIVNLTLIVKAELNKNEIADFFGYTPFIVASGSMEPVLKVQDVIVTQKVDENQLKIGDIIAYYDAEDNIVITHRIAGIVQDGTQKVYQMKGDNNVSIDTTIVTKDNIQGKYAFTIPFIGKIATFVGTPLGLLITIGIIILIYIILDLTDRIIRNRKEDKQSINFLYL